MKAPLKARRPSPDEALAIATTTAPQQPPALVAELSMDVSTTFNLRVKTSTVAAVAAAAKVRGMTMKQVICQALQTAGVAVAADDLEDRSPRRHMK